MIIRVQLLHKRSVLQFTFSGFHLQLLLKRLDLRFKIDNVRVRRAQLLIQRGDGQRGDGPQLTRSSI
jgi:hypothetical protein